MTMSVQNESVTDVDTTSKVNIEIQNVTMLSCTMTTKLLSTLW